MDPKAKGWLRFALVVILLAAAAVSVRFLARDAWSPEALRAHVAAAGAWAPFVFVAVFAAGLVLVLPATPFTLAAGFLFGPVLGVPVAWAGLSLGAVAAYFLARFGGGPVKAALRRRFDRVARFVDSHGLGTVLTLRLVPVFPYNALNYGLGLAGVPPRAYVVGTVLGVLPLTVAYVLVGAAAGHATDYSDPAFWGPLALALALVAAGALVARRLRARADAGDGS